MVFMLCRHKVRDFAMWHSVFASHAEAQRKAGLHLLHLLRDTTDPSHVVYLFKVDDIGKAKAFTSTPDASKAGEESGVVGIPEMIFLND